MIRTLTLADVATYPIGGMQIGPLAKCNFVYGPNGSGKTTLSRYLADQQGEAFEACSVVWRGGRALRTDVYNRDFLQDAFSEDGKTKGVFTLGEEGKEAKERISELTDDIAAEKIATINNPVSPAGRPSRINIGTSRSGSLATTSAAGPPAC